MARPNPILEATILEYFTSNDTITRHGFGLPHQIIPNTSTSWLKFVLGSLNHLLLHLSSLYALTTHKLTAAPS
jgi:hypothetical protein